MIYLNNSETLFLHSDGDYTVVASVDGSIYGIGYTSDEAIEDAIDNGFTEEELEGIKNDYNCLEDEWYDDDEEDY